MKLKAKITRENLKEILSGKKGIELRGIESLELSDGDETHLFKIESIHSVSEHMGDMLKGCFPQYLGEEDTVAFIELGEEIDLSEVPE